ncbi:uncharacterized protein LOC133525066 [Cydia pomonella]|uniref:uncharacterized protein LOC133525066 n=1 Tax=Cydia pomonella TaxID=82600 RepID=UPI002ADE9205|nr:uncharacterized protein LOC133525066 [Cydia pomonella]
MGYLVTSADRNQDFVRMIRSQRRASVETRTPMETGVLVTPFAADSEKPTLDEKFITEFETLSELWNSQHKDYTNKLKRQKGYNKLLTIFKRYKPNATVDDVRKKINSLRSNYRRELRRIAETHKNGDIYTPRSKSFKLLSFLYDTEMPDYTEQKPQTVDVFVKCEEPETTESLQLSMSPVNETFDYNSISPTQTSKSECELAFLSSVQSQYQQVQHPLLQTAKENFNGYNSISPTMQDSKSRVCQPAFLPTGSPTYQQPLQQTTAWSLAHIWSQKLEKMEPMQRLLAEKAINDVLFEAELGNLNRNSVKIN